VGLTKLKTIVLITATLLVLASFIVNQRANLLIYSMTSSELPELLEPKDEGEKVTWFDDYYTIQKIDERTFAIGEPRYYQLNFNYLILGDSRAIIFDAGTGQRDIRRVVENLTDLPITFIPSHLHYDHIGNEVIFEKTALVDLPHLRKRATDNKLPLTRFEHLGEVEGYSLPELKISEWLIPNETIDLGDRLLWFSIHPDILKTLFLFLIKRLVTCFQEIFYILDNCMDFYQIAIWATTYRVLKQ